MPLAALATLPPPDEMELHVDTLSLTEVPKAGGPMARLGICAHSRRGRGRKVNQDAVALLGLGSEEPLEQSLLVQRGPTPRNALTLSATQELLARTRPTAVVLAVADGLGGHGGGEIASHLAVQTAGCHLHRHLVGALSRFDRVAHVIREAFVGAQHAVQRVAEASNTPAMGTTLTLVCLTERQCYVGHVGDSRCYRLRGGRLDQLTTDHTLGQLSTRSPQHAIDLAQLGDGAERVLYNAIGAGNDKLSVDVHHFNACAGDRLLLCTDGVHDHLALQSLATTLGRGRPALAALHLVKSAIAEGSDDDATALVASL